MRTMMTLQTREAGSAPAPEINRGPDAVKNHHKAESRLCRHALTGRIRSAKLCIHDYACHRCAFDQWLDETDDYPADFRALKFTAAPRAADDYDLPARRVGKEAS